MQFVQPALDVFQLNVPEIKGTEMFCIYNCFLTLFEVQKFTLFRNCGFSVGLEMYFNTVQFILMRGTQNSVIKTLLTHHTQNFMIAIILHLKGYCHICFSFIKSTKNGNGNLIQPFCPKVYILWCRTSVNIAVFLLR